MYYGIPTTIPVIQNDFAYTLGFTLTDSLGVPLNLTAASLTFNAQLDSEYPVSWSNGMTIEDAADGTCSYTVNANDFIVAGIYNVQIKVSYSSGAEIITFGGIQVVVSAVLPFS